MKCKLYLWTLDNVLSDFIDGGSLIAENLAQIQMIWLVLIVIVKVVQIHHKTWLGSQPWTFVMLLVFRLHL